MKLWKRRATEFAHDEFTGWACCYGVDDYLLSEGASREVRIARTLGMRVYEWPEVPA